MVMIVGVGAIMRILRRTRMTHDVLIAAFTGVMEHDSDNAVSKHKLGQSGLDI